MNPVQLVFLVFLIVPFIEIYLLLQIGGIVGVFPTILLVVSTAIIGAGLLRQQGLATWQRFQDNLQKGEIPAYEMVEGPILLVGGALLLTPGFFTDVIGFACLIPPARKKIAQYIIEKRLVQAGVAPQRQKPKEQPGVIEGEFKRDD
ncbi:exlusion protein FxsA [Methylococcaceae bacterium HT1]|nr:FxsA family protein [Methyloprofundus sp.]TXK96660.1 exlusion protein FxsA [Methylococcaceae bacterium HT1]TXK97676.1 exlusion protein FxsA [Methylococcaceae bacterium CS4]TXK99965.1 exlusion protein FxsA [Methylococcaceae bacterium CS5]TXL02396.1 exlusion protein FxsA [Methylococcaceae bacterium CS3]TXL06885.1 exlusion protein FxsA [Methylococcaceae bacterium CS1]TXL10936.1 exlusion protein FxsA [Methylococcaceae bacterium CS2]TXL12418.1 exlusion protein FxsA [Methylococcaceae bacterium 